MIRRRESKPPNIAPRPLPPATGLRGGGYKGPQINKGRHLPTQVAAFEEGHHGQQSKRRKKWF